MAYRSPSGSNTFTPAYEISLALVQATRDPASFKLARYIQYVKTDLRVFYYCKLDLDEPARLVTQNEFLWAPGQDAPTYNNIGAFQFVQAATLKYGFAWTLPNEAIDQAAWDLDASQMGIVSQKAMTNRVMAVATLTQTASNWPSSNTSTANTLNAGAGKFDTASSDPADTHYLAIRKALTAAQETIVLQTNGSMKIVNMNFVGSPKLFKVMGNTSEIFDYTKGSPDSFRRQEGTEERFYGEFGMPSRYASMEMVCEDAVKVTSRPNVTTGLATSGTRDWVWDSTKPAILARKGSVEGKYGGPSLSTVQLYYYRNMETFTKSDTDNERQAGRIVDDIVALLPFGQSGYLIEAAM